MKSTGEMVALKEEFSTSLVTTLREIEILKSLQGHPSIVELKQVVTDRDGRIYLAMEYVEHDLNTYLRSMTSPFLTMHAVKDLMKQLLHGVKFMHERSHASGSKAFQHSHQQTRGA